MTKGSNTQVQDDAFIRELLPYRGNSYGSVESLCSFSPRQDNGFHPAASQLWDITLPDSSIVRQTSPSLEIEHASPLAPLRKQDVVALESFFANDRIEEITLDVYRHLALMYPEPCWEDEPHELFNSYL